MSRHVSDKGRKAFQAERTERAKARQFGNVTYSSSSTEFAVAGFLGEDGILTERSS